jgi:phosphomethylpyrimidine synthase
MKITEVVRKYAEQGVTEEEALERGMEEKSKEFVDKGTELYAKAKNFQPLCRDKKLNPK